ncbi:hypothetical protein RAD15_28615 [Bradyrhizobium sp. 14AA]
MRYAMPIFRLRYCSIWLSAALLVGTTLATTAQYVPNRPTDPNQRQVVLVHQDTSDCSGRDVPNTDSPSVRGTIWATRLFDGNTSVKVAITARPNTVYHVSLKCVRPIGDIKTDDEGVGILSLVFPTNLVGAEYSFELAPEVASAGSRYQSAQISFK